MATTFDLAEFAKLRALMDAAPTPSEQARPRLKARMMARAAGLTLEQAIAEADKAREAARQSEPAPAKQGPLHNSVQTLHGPLQALAAAFDTPETRAFEAKHEDVRQTRRRVLLQEYGSEEVILAETEREAALRTACAPLIAPGQQARRPDLIEAASRAWPLPTTVEEAWAELAEMQRLADAREAVHPGEYRPPAWVELRRVAVEGLLDTLPAANRSDLFARLSWMEHLNEQEVSRDVREEARLLATVRADIERLGVQSGQGTAAVVSLRTANDRRKAVLALLVDPATAELSDREIARRAGVSPQTVETWRQRAAGKRP